jgi:hypothetical protein
MKVDFKASLAASEPIQDFSVAVKLCSALNMDITKSRVERHLASAKEFSEAMEELDKRIPFKGFAAVTRKRPRLGQGYELLESIGCSRCGAETDKRLIDESSPENPSPKICENCRQIIEEEQMQQAAQAAMRRRVKKTMYKPNKREIQILRETMNPW